MSKLVRDKIIEMMKADGKTPTSHIADDAEYWTKLKAKLAEEAGEFVRDESVNEIADVLEVIDAIIAFKGFDRGEIEKAKKTKFDLRGGFGKRIILDQP
jgi:predicted house-cleaning noncanonical NTP pyrophosphatase (MazG superfamily)